MSMKIVDVMAQPVILAKPNYGVQHVGELMKRHAIHAVPVVGPDRKVRGIVSTADLVQNWSSETPVEQVMSVTVKTVNADAEVSEAAAIMRQHHIHHVVVTDQDLVVGMVSSLDLLKLIEGS